MEKILNQNDLQKIRRNVEKQERFFEDKSLLDAFTSPPEIVGRQKQAEELVRHIVGYKKNFVVPLISIYGRSGSGKSTLVRFICENLQDDLSYCYVNLRKAKTIFGSVNLILGELGMQNLKSAQGINTALEKIEDAIEKKLVAENKKLFVLVLDEFDVLFFDKRGKPSDFIYKLLVLEENLKKKKLLTCIISISNNVLSDYELDDRVRSRIGSSEIFFSPYSKEEIVKIIGKRARIALASDTIDDAVLDYCAEQSSLGHGDARRAIDLLRVAAELASLEGGKKILQKHIDEASEKLQKDRISTVLSTASFHLKVACYCLARLSYLTGEEWHPTSTLYKQYQIILPKNIKPLSYRRVSELLVDLENTGLVKSYTSSKGRHGYGTQYKLVELPETVGKICFSENWDEVVAKKKEHSNELERMSLYENMGRRARGGGLKNVQSILRNVTEESWKDFVGTD